MSWAKRLQKVVPLSSVAFDTARFDTQAMLNPQLSCVEYQQGELDEYKPLQIAQVLLQASGSSGKGSNLAFACSKCKTVKGILDVYEFLVGKPEGLRKLHAHLAPPLKDATAVNVTRYAIGDALKDLGLPVSFCSGGIKNFNRESHGNCSGRDSPRC